MVSGFLAGSLTRLTHGHFCPTDIPRPALYNTCPTTLLRSTGGPHQPFFVLMLNTPAEVPLVVGRQLVPGLPYAVCLHGE